MPFIQFYMYASLSQRDRLLRRYRIYDNDNVLTVNFNILMKYWTQIIFKSIKIWSVFSMSNLKDPYSSSFHPHKNVIHVILIHIKHSYPSNTNIYQTLILMKWSYLLNFHTHPTIIIVRIHLLYSSNFHNHQILIKILKTNTTLKMSIVILFIRQQNILYGCTISTWITTKLYRL